MKPAIPLMLLLLMTGPAPAREPTLVPMPADIHPHRPDFIAGPRHYDISGHAEEIHHFGDHYITHGQHNYDMSDDPSNRSRFPHESRRYRGMGIGRFERHTMLMRSIEDIPHVPQEHWVDRNLRRRGLDYQLPPEDEEEELARRARGFPRPSWYVNYAGRKKHTSFK